MEGMNTYLGVGQKPGNLLYNSRLQQIEKATDLFDQAHLFFPKSVVIICKDEKFNTEPCPDLYYSEGSSASKKSAVRAIMVVQSAPLK